MLNYCKTLTFRVTLFSQGLRPECICKIYLKIKSPQVKGVLQNLYV